MKRLYSLILSGLLATYLAGFAQSSIDESLVTQTITVDQNGSGPNNYTSLTSAASFLNQTANKSENFKVSIAAGTYREGDIYLNGRTGVTVIEGSAAGDVIFTGADIWTGWTHDGSGNYSKPWTNDWGLAEYNPEHYDIQDDLGKRAEMVFLNGIRMTQVADKASLVDDSYAVDETNDLLWIRLAGGADPDAAGTTVEVSTRNLAMFFFKSNNLVLRNLVFENYANSNQLGNGTYVVALFGDKDNNIPSNHLLIDNCEFRGNNNGGLTLNRFNYLTFRDSKFKDNGNAGAGLSRLNHTMIEGCEFSGNNWRVGGYGGFTGWAPAGTKLFYFGHTTIRNCSFLDNLATGLWLDTGGENVFVYDCIANNNDGGAGIYVEACYGPTYIDNCTVNNNAIADTSEGLNHGGILIAESRAVTITNCTIEDNHHSQIMIRTRDRPEPEAGYVSQTSFDGYVEDITILGNRLKGKELYNAAKPEPSWLSTSTRQSGLIMMTTQSQEDPNGGPNEYKLQFLPTLTIDNNSYWHEDRTVVFSTGGDSGFERQDLDGWKAYNSYGFDTNSVWEETAGETIQVVLEAEDGNPTSPMATVTDAGASAGAYLTVNTAATQIATPTVASATYTFDVRETGTYGLIMSTKAANSGDDSVWVNVNDTGWINWNGITASTDWNWDYLRDAGNGYQRVNYDLDTGIHTLEIAYREDGLNIDQIVFTTSPTYTGVGGTVIDAKHSSPNISRGVITGISSDHWTRVNFSNNYESPVVVGTVLSPGQSATPAAVRVRHANATGFDVRVAPLVNNETSITRDLHFVSVEEGVYSGSGYTMEAAKTTSTLTDYKQNLVGQGESYSGTYTNPIVLGQVTSDNDSDWSVFWSRGVDRSNPATASTLYVGKHVGEDIDNSRVDEELSYIVIESGSGSINGVPFTAGLTSDSIRGVDNAANGYDISFTAVNSADTAIVSAAEMDGTDGGFPVLSGGGIQNDSTFRTVIDEDQIGDSERQHTTETVSYLILGN